MEKVKEVKTALEHFSIRTEQPQKDKPTQTSEGLHVGETVQITA